MYFIGEKTQNNYNKLNLKNYMKMCGRSDLCKHDFWSYVNQALPNPNVTGKKKCTTKVLFSLHEI